ncbi:hypothetical protein CR513_26124, partial [Mucuna pruriens]
MDRSMIDAASRGALMDKTPVAARHLISNMASNMQQFGVRGPSPSQLVSEIGATSNQRLENQLTELTSLHPTDMCPMLQETESDHSKSVGAIGGYKYRKQSYQSWPFDNQQYGRQPFWLGLNQGPYAAQQFGSTLNAH